MACEKDKNSDDFYEELRLLQIANDMDLKLRLYVGLEALFGEAFSANAVAKKKPHMQKMIRTVYMSTGDVMWAMEHFLSKHPECQKAFPMVCKALYDEDWVEEKSFIERYKNESHTNSGFAEAKKLSAAFVTWLETEEEESSSDDSSD